MIMIKKSLFLLIVLPFLWATNASGQTAKSTAVHPVSVKLPHDFSISIPVRDMKPATPLTAEQIERNHEIKEEHEKNTPSRKDYHVTHNTPPVIDPVWQRTMPQRKTRGDNAPSLIFQGQDATDEDGSSNYFPSDCNGAIGPDYFMQTVNTIFSIYDRDGNLVDGPHNMNTLFSGVDGADENDGDPIVLWDEKANRWLALEFSISGSQDYMLLAVSKTDDPTGEWYRWSYEMADMPDYPHLGIWQNGYYMAINDDDDPDVFAFDRDAMIAGDANPQMVSFDNPYRPNSGFHIIEPLDNDGDWAPSGTPGQFITIDADEWGSSDHVNSGKDELWIYELDVDWNDAGNATFDRTQVLVTADFDPDMGSGMDNVEQKDESQKVDAIPQILMYRAQYRNFDGDQIIVCAHTVDVDDSDHGGIRWYELEKTSTDGDWSIRQQGTYAPDEHSRFQPSIAMDKHKNIAIGYSISSSSMYPGIRYTGQTCKERKEASGTLDIPEEVIYEGTQSQSENARWGDYAELTVDPRDDLTFWFTNEYYDDNKKTKVAVWKFPACGDIDNLLAEAKSTSKIDVSWTPNDDNDKVLLAYSDDGTFGDPTDGHEYAVGDNISGGGIVLAYGNDTLYHHTGLDCGTKYYYKAWSYKSDDTYSDGATTDATTWNDTITVQPHDTSACDGDDITLKLTVVGNGLSYQWQKDDADISGATDPTYTLSNVSSSDEANYRCVVKGTCGDVTSDEAAFNIADPTEITSEPTEKTVCESESASLSISATGDNLSYQWRKNGTEVSGATSTSLSFPNVTPGDRGMYSCIVTGGCGIDTSDAVALYVKDTAILLYEDFEGVTNGDTIPPTGWTRKQGTEGSSDDAYGWEFGDADNLSSTNFPVTDHTLFAASNDDKHTTSSVGGMGGMGGTSNDAGTDYLLTPSLNLTGYDNVELSFETFFMEKDGSKAYIKVSTDGGSSWENVDSVASEEAWVTKTVNLSSYIGETDVIINFHHNDQGGDVLGYAIDNVIVSACVTCPHDVSINTQPNNQEVCEGTDASFSVAASGSDLLYQWEKDGEQVDGANDATATISAVTLNDEGNYRCVVANGCGYTVNSNTGNLIVDEAISITANPEDQNLSEGSDAHFGVQVTGTVSSYQWIKDGNDLSDGGNISGSTTDSLTISSATSSDKGYYKVRLTGPCNELTSDSAILDIATDIQDLNAIGVNMYPNPTTTLLTIDATQITHIKVVDMTGRTVIEKDVATENQTKVSFAHLPAGTYIIYGNYAKGQFKAKIIKRK